MSKRAPGKFKRRPQDAYDTPPEAVAPLLPHLPPGTFYAEPCAGKLHLVDALGEAGHKCTYAQDIALRDFVALLKPRVMSLVVFTGAVGMLLAPGSRVGILGSNGSGKTTLIRVLSGDLPPDEGTIAWADDLKIVVFGQQREELPQDVTLREALAGKDQSVDFRGRNIHISSWAKRFLFAADQLDMPVGELSGGEQARVLIARLMLRPADLLILDEPTNDLDIASLEVLEQSLTEFPGAIVLVTHDRYMLDRICTEIIGLDGDGQVGRYGDSTQWQAAQVRSTSEDGGAKAGAKKPKRTANRVRLSGSEKRELEEMERTILEADERVELCRRATEDPAVAGDHVEAQERWAELETAKKQVEALYARWEELESKAKAT
ncbi:MAG: ATP-binding cassette domain-containing protein [Armatimonadetes bacterium]|nr:ATP-binding cassette domain-containing protein [Armatimonadota bacterium]